jgi:hypothetical protein
MSSSPPTEPAGDAAAVLARLLDDVEAGRVADWRPLPAGATTSTLTAVRPGAEPARDLTTLLGQPAVGYRLPATPHTPGGVVVWTQHDEVTLIEVLGPELAAGQLEALGAPEAALESGLGWSLEQWLWPDRGLILHVVEASGRVARLYGHEATTSARIQASPLAKVSLERHPR